MFILIRQTSFSLVKHNLNAVNVQMVSNAVYKAVIHKHGCNTMKHKKPSPTCSAADQCHSFASVWSLGRWSTVLSIEREEILSLRP